jgi:hypothetical protein
MYTKDDQRKVIPQHEKNKKMRDEKKRPGKEELSM